MLPDRGRLIPGGHLCPDSNTGITRLENQHRRETVHSQDGPPPLLGRGGALVPLYILATLEEEPYPPLAAALRGPGVRRQAVPLAAEPVRGDAGLGVSHPIFFPCLSNLLHFFATPSTWFDPVFRRGLCPILDRFGRLPGCHLSRPSTLVLTVTSPELNRPYRQQHLSFGNTSSSTAPHFRHTPRLNLGSFVSCGCHSCRGTPPVFATAPKHIVANLPQPAPLFSWLSTMFFSI